jgi:hypothetical protein
MELLYKNSNKKTDAEMLEMIAEMEKKLISVNKRNLELTKKIDVRAKNYAVIEDKLLTRLQRIQEQVEYDK